MWRRAGLRERIARADAGQLRLVLSLSDGRETHLSSSPAERMHNEKRFVFRKNDGNFALVLEIFLSNKP